MITEPWARVDISDAELSIDNFVVFRNDGKIFVRCGCTQYVKNCCNTTLVEDLTNDPDTKKVLCKLILSNMSILIGIWYNTTSVTVAN